MNIPYGRSSIEVPDLWKGRAAVLAPGPFPATDPEKILAHSLDEPLGGVKLETRCRPGDRVACVIPDLTRRAAVRDYLPVVLHRLSEAGVRPADVMIVVALGIHRPMTERELRTLVGDAIFAGYNVVNHDPDGKESNILLGTTDAGIPVEINRYVAGADCVLLTGGVTFHYFAGYGGGRKALLPGVASRQACEAHHRLVVSWRRGELEGQMAPGVLENNPVHHQMVQACRCLPSIFVLNVVTRPDGRVIAASAGELEAAHRDACRKHDAWFRKELEEPSRLVIAGAGGFPKDVNFVQAHKALHAAHQAAAPGGVVILAAECPEGAGHADLIGWFERCHTEEKWLTALEDRYQINGQTAFSTWLKVTATPTVLVSRLRSSEVRTMGMIPAGTVREALTIAGGILGDLPVPLLIPDAGDVLPVIKSPKQYRV